MTNKYAKTTEGLNAQVIVAKAVAYTTDATYKLFVANAVDGEIGVYLVYDASGPTTYTQDNAALNAADTPLATGDKFFIAQKVGDTIKKTQILTYGAANGTTVRQKAYVAPVKQVSHVGYNGTSGSLNEPTLAAGQIYSLSFLETTPGNQPYPTWNYEKSAKASDDIYDILLDLSNQANSVSTPQNIYNDRIVDTVITSNGSRAAFANTVAVTNGDATVTITAHGLSAGDFVKFHGSLYQIASVTDANNFELDREYLGATEAAIATADADSGVYTTITEYGIKATSVDYGTHFRIAVQEDLADADIDYTTNFKQGVGTSDSVADLEKEGWTFSGVTTQNTAFASDYGQPVAYTVDGTTYSFIYIDYLATMPSVAHPVVTDAHYGHIILACPVGVAPFTNLDGIFV